MAGRLSTSSDGLVLAGANAPDVGSFSLTALVYLSGAPNSAVYEAINAWSRRFTAGGYFFSGKQGSSNDGYVDSWSVAAYLGGAAAPLPQDTWFQWAISCDKTRGSSEQRVMWKLIGDVAWHTAGISVPGGPIDGRFFVPDFWVMGSSEYGDSAGRFRFSNVKVWSVGLSDAILLADANSADVVHAANLRNWWKMLSGGLLHDSGPAATDLLCRVVTGSGVQAGAGSFVDVADSPLEAPPDAGSNVTGTTDAQLPLLTGAGSGQYVESGVGAGQMPLLVGAGFGQYVELGGVTGLLPVLIGAGSGQYTEYGVVTGQLPLLIGAGEGTPTGAVSGVVNAFLPLLVGSAFGQITTTRVEIVAPDMVGDDPNEFGRPMSFGGNIGGARGFAQLTSGSVMSGGRSQVRKPGQKRWQ